MKKISFILLIAIFFLALFYFIYKDKLFVKPGVINVIAEGKISVQPQTAKLTVTWLATDANPAEALKKEKK